MQSEKARKYVDEFNAEFAEWGESLGYDYKAEENQEQFIKDKAEYISRNLDRAEWVDLLDYEIFDNIIEFYLEACE